MKAKLRKLLNIQAAKARLEEEARQKAERLKEERKRKEEERGHNLGGQPPKALDGVPGEKDQSNFTDPESRIMKTKDGFEQAHNCQAAVDSENQVIVAETVTSQQNDGDELVPMVERIRDLTGEYPEQVSADAGYCSEANIEAMAERDVDAYIATGRQKHGTASATNGDEEKGGPLTKGMREKLRAGGYESPYRLRKQVVEPVFGQIKQARGFRQFLHRGLSNVRRDWSMICTATTPKGKRATAPQPAEAVRQAGRDAVDRLIRRLRLHACTGRAPPSPGLRRMPGVIDPANRQR